MNLRMHQTLYLESTILLLFHSTTRAIMGPPSKFPAAAESRLKSIMAEYTQHLINGSDDLTWKKSRCEDFLIEFQIELDATSIPMAKWREVRSSCLLSCRLLISKLSGSCATTLTQKHVL